MKFRFRRRAGLHPTPLWRRYLRFLRPDVDADVDDELRFHLDMSAADLERRGHTREDAERLARERFGEVGVVRDWLTRHDRRRQRDDERADLIDALVQDLRYAARRLAQQRGFTAVVVLVLGLGIGITTAMFSAVDAALLRPLPFQRDERLVSVSGIDIPIRELAGAQRSAEIDDARAMRSVFTHVAAYAPGGLNLSDPNAPVRLDVALVTPDLFATLGVAVARGRGFAAGEGKPDGQRVAILSDALWRRQFGADTSVLDHDVRLNDIPYQVVGVMPPGFRFPQKTELWLPLTVPATLGQFEAFRGWLPSTFVARLAPGVGYAQAEAAVATLIRRFQSPERRAEPLEHPVVEPLRDALVGKRRTALLVLMGATGLVLLIACANVANLLLARTLSRRGELALRAMLGAGRGRLLRQLLVESMLLAFGGAAFGLLVAYGGVKALATLMPPALAGTAAAQVDARVLAFSLVTTLLTGLLAGVWPALIASRTNASETMSAPAATAGREGMWVRRAFVVTELALALMLAVGTGLMLRSLDALLSSDSGVRSTSVATLELTLPTATYGSPKERRRFFDEVMERMRAAPGVEEAAVVNELPLRGKGGMLIAVTAEGRARGPDAEQPPMAQPLQTTPSYFSTLGIPILRGRTFTVPYDSARPEAVISEMLARRLWPGEEAVGKRLSGGIPGLPSAVVVGVVGDVRPWSLESERVAQMYLPIAASPPVNAALLARGTLDPNALAVTLREAVRAVDPTQAVYNVRPMTAVISGAIAPRRTNTALISLFGVIAVGLAAIGVYGVIAYGVGQRMREIGIRMALGARSSDIIGLVAREGIVLAALGVLLGLAGAWALRRIMAALLYGVKVDDPVAFTGAAVVLLGIAMTAALVPARKALRVDPVITMRAE